MIVRAGLAQRVGSNQITRHWTGYDETAFPEAYGETDIVAALLVMFPIEAVMVTCPPLVIPATAETTPADTVAKFVLLDVHVATEVTSGDPLQVVAVALSVTVAPELAPTLPLVGSSVIAVIHPTVTVTLCVPVIDGF